MRRKIIKTSSFTVFFIIVLLVYLNPDILEKLGLNTKPKLDKLVYNYSERITTLSPIYDTVSARIDKVNGNILRKDYPGGHAIVINFPEHPADEDINLNFTLLKPEDLAAESPLPADKKLVGGLVADLRLVPTTFINIELGIIPKLKKEAQISFLYKKERSLDPKSVAIYQFKEKTGVWEKMINQNYISETELLTISVNVKIFGVFALLTETTTEDKKLQIESLQNQLKFLLEKLKKLLSSS